MIIHTIEGVTPRILESGLNSLRDSGFSVAQNRVSGMGIEATFELAANVLTVTVEKSPAFLAGMVENQLRAFFR